MTGCVGTAYREKDISTHILTKRMTPGRLGGRFQKHISTHILTKRMTDCRTICVSKNIFQLTSSRRGWHRSRSRYSHYQNFNSHPHEEDDRIPRHASNLLFYFNSHPHEEDDDNYDTEEMGEFIFQLTSSRRGWPCRGEIRSRWIYFNSHPHEEDDSFFAYWDLNSDISTHILTKRMTSRLCACIPHGANFNSHPHEEDDG